MTTFDVLFSFVSPDFELLEIRRQGLPDGSALSEVYKWLLVVPKSGRVLEFDFTSMEKSPKQRRVFKEGQLEFDETAAQLRLLERSFTFSAGKPSQLSLKAVMSFLEHPRDEHYRDLKPSDVTFFEDWIVDEEVIRYSLTRFHLMKEKEDIRRWFLETLLDAKVFQKGILREGKLVGHAGISGINLVDRNGEFFIFIGNKSWWGKGIGSRATKMLTDLAFCTLPLDRIFLTASSDNLAGVRAYEKAGYRHEGRMRKAFFRNQQHSDKLIMGILREEWASSCGNVSDPPNS